MKAKKKVGKYGRLVLEVLKHAGADADEYHTKIAVDGDYAYCAINVEGRPVDWWILKYLKELPHDKDNPNLKINAQVFLAAHKKEKEKKTKMHYQMVLDKEDPDWYLDNHAISLDVIKIKRQFKRIDGKPPLFKGKQVSSFLVK